MVDRFENLTSGITQIYKSIQKIKRCRMDSLGLKGTHVMCLHYLSEYPKGLTAADLCGKCTDPERHSQTRIPVSELVEIL